LLSFLTIILVGVVVLVAASQFILPTAFNRHMGGMMNGGMGMGMSGQGFGNSDTMTQLYADFRSSFNEALAYAASAATIVAVALSLLLSRSVIAPLRAMSLATQRIADGRYDERVQVRGSDELAQLAGRFNQMAHNLDEVEKMRLQLIGDVSHELRTPLTSIKGCMEGLVDGLLPAIPETFNQIHQEANRLSRLVDDLQELSRVEARAYSLDIHPAGLASLVQTTVKRLSPQANAKHIEIHPNLPADLPQVLADEDRITQVLTNLLDNAIAYTPEGGSVTIGAAQAENEIQISVADTGPGIPAEHLPHIFERFYRADKSRTRRAGGGSGIGLTIARHLVEAHGGRIWAQSTEGQGSKLTFTLKKAL
jgi:histidine kinase